MRHPCGRSRWRRSSLTAVLAVMLTGGLASDAVAATPANAFVQNAGPPQVREPEPDFFLGRPDWTIGLRGGVTRPRAKSDLFDFVREQLTIGRRDFDGPGFVAEFGKALTSRLEVVGGLELARARVSSEYRDFVDNNRLPIEQTTSLSTVGLTGSLRASLTPRGREVSQLVWVPARITPYVGAGGGLIRYQFQQRGDFVDFVDLDVFSDVFRSAGWVPTAHAFAGINLRVYRALSLSTEGRYSWASGELSEDFVNFDPIDLAGFRMTGGINVVF